MITRRFDDFREITAKFDSTSTCGHVIKKGEAIGISFGSTNWKGRYSKGETQTCCTNCWLRWVSENREAEAIEQGFMPNCY